MNGFYIGGMLVYNTFGEYSEKLTDVEVGENDENRLSYFDITLATTGGFNFFNPTTSISPFIELNIGASYYYQHVITPSRDITYGPSDWFYISPAAGLSIPLSSSIFISGRFSYSITIQSGQSNDGDFMANTLLFGPPEAGLTEYQYISIIAGIEFVF